MLCAHMYRQNSDLENLLKSARKKNAPECPFECGGGGAKAKRAMPKCPLREFEWGFPYIHDINLILKIGHYII